MPTGTKEGLLHFARWYSISLRNYYIDYDEGNEREAWYEQ
jgi:hypothetical protein